MKKYLKKTLSVILSLIIIASGSIFIFPQITGTSASVNAADIPETSEYNETSDSNTDIPAKDEEVKPREIRLSKSSLTLEKGKNEILTAEVLPEDAADKTVIWSSSDDNIATVTDGAVTAISGGSAEITAKTANGLTAVCNVTVTAAAEEIKLSQTSITLDKGKTAVLTAEILPEDTSDKTVTWSSSDENVAIVSNGTVIAISGGTADITAASPNGLTAVCRVTVTVPAESITIGQTSLTLEKGETCTLVAKVYPQDTTDKSVKWSTSDLSVVSVNGGKITAKAPGTAIITASTANGKTASYTVKVVIMPESIKLDKSSLTLEKGKSQNLKVTLNPGNTTEKAVTWSTSNSNVVTVSKGKITAKAAGTATVTVSTVNGKTAKCTIKVIVKPTSVKLSKTSVTLGKGKTYTLKAELYPKDTTEKKITWTSSNNKVLSVSNGKLTAKSLGTATITVKTSNGKTAKCTVKVAILATSVKLSKTTVSIAKGKTYKLTATVNPNNTTYKNVTWTSSNTKVATVQNGKITAKAVGTATITAKTSNGKTAACKVTVRIYPTSIKLNKTSLSICKGKTATLSATISPADATLKNVSWTSSDSKIVTVNNGKITAKNVGTATITAKTSNGKKATCKVSVKYMPTKISLSKTSLTLKAGSSTTLKTTLTPNKNVISTVSWSSSDNAIATVNNGKITAKKAGTVVITAKTANGKTAKCTVKVYIVNYNQAYTPEQVYKDISYLQSSYPDIIKVSTIGKSVKKRDIKLIQLGKGSKKALIVGGIHAREHITVSFVMRSIEEYADAYCNNKSYGGYNIRSLLDKYTLYLVPMSNPDGTQIANTSEKPLYVSPYFENDSYKGNANGVNLNRNFPFCWEGATDGLNKNQTNYRGPSAGSEPETKAIIDLCSKNNFQFMLSMHILGGGIYWRDAGNGTINNDYKLASGLSKKCGYLLFENTTVKSEYAGGLENWFRYKYKKPGFCIEMIPFRCYDLSETYKGYNTYFEKSIDWSNTKYTFAEAMRVM